ADNAALHAAAHGAGHLVCRRLGVKYGKRTVGEDSFRGFDLMDEIGKSFYIVKRDDGSVLLILRRGGQRASNTKEPPLNLLGPGADILVVADAAGKAQHGVQLIDGAVGLDAQ